MSRRLPRVRRCSSGWRHAGAPHRPSRSNGCRRLAPLPASRLHPWQPLSLPALLAAAMALRSEPSLEPVRYVEGLRISCSRRRHRRMATAIAGAADEIKRCALIDAELVELGFQAADEIGNQRSGRKLVPFDEHRGLADRGQHRNADVGPYGLRAHVDECRRRRSGEAVPCFFNADVAGVTAGLAFRHRGPLTRTTTPAAGDASQSNAM